MNRKIGPLLLSGLMIGPILGSGIVLLPPMAYGLLGGGSIWAWLIMMILGALFAMIFSKLTLLHPGDGGMTNAIEVALGKKFKLYASLLMITAVSFGPTAVMLTAAEYLNKLHILEGTSPAIIAIVLVLISFFVLMRDAKFISTVSLVISSIIAIILLVCSLIVLKENGIQVASVSTMDLSAFGKTVLLLFWAIIGWEIIGNYSSQVKDLNKTLPIATGISILVITATYLVISLAIQSFPYTDSLSLVEIIQPIFGPSSTWILALLITGLCLCTYLLIVGGLARLICQLAEESALPELLKKRNHRGVAVNGIYYFIIVHILVLTLSFVGLLDISSIVKLANAYFLLNAVIGLIAAIYVIKSNFFRVASIILALSLSLILCFSSLPILASLIGIFLVSLYLERRQKKILPSRESNFN